MARRQRWSGVGLAYVGFLALSAAGASAAPVATVVLDGADFIQSGQVTNNYTSNLIEFVYSLGTPEDNLATWDTDTGGGTASDFLSNPQFFQTVTFSGLNIAPSGVFNFTGLDIDLILTLVPLSVTGVSLGGPETLRNAFVLAKFADGTVGSANLIQQEWNQTQTLVLEAQGPGAVPEPATLASAACTGLFVLAYAWRRRRAA